MEENEGKDLAKDMKDEVVLQEKYYENVKLELEKIILSNVTLAEKHIQREEKGKEILYGKSFGGSADSGKRRKAS